MIKFIFGIYLTVMAVALLLFTVQNFFGSQSQLEPKAANMFLLVTGLPGLLLAWGGIALIRSYSKRSHQSSPNIGKTFGNAQSPGIKYCRKCGAQLQASSNFCPKCGTNAVT